MNNVFAWQAPQYPYYEKSFGWYVSVVFVLIVFVGYLILNTDYFAAVCIFIIGTIFILLASQKPSTINISLTNRSLHVDDLSIPYKQIKHFWIVNNDNHRTLNLHINTVVQPLLHIELMDQDVDEIRDFLSDYIIEHEEEDESFIQKIAHKFNI